MSPEAVASTTFDFLIAAGGTASLVLAIRLTEIPTISVGVIEADEVLTNDTTVLIPLCLFDVTGDLKNDWNFTNKPQETLEGPCTLQNRGKMLGGSSEINYMQLVFASRADLDGKALGNTGWHYDFMAPYYRKFEIFREARLEQKASGLKSFINEDAHGYGGPINTSSPSRLLGQKRWPTWAWLQLRQNRRSRGHRTELHGQQPTLHSKCLQRNYHIRRDYEIGAAKLLESFGIETLIFNANVGENLQDDPQDGMPFIPAEGELTFDDVYKGNWTAFWTSLYHEKGKGQLAGGVSHTAQLSWNQIITQE
ncbi:MAG: hypothetical protein Q9204_002358 [Flavoplaca sp. TL-2023a]